MDTASRARSSIGGTRHGSQSRGGLQLWRNARGITSQGLDTRPRGSLRSVMQQVAEKLYRIRQPSGELSPYAALPPGGVVSSSGDPWVKGLLIGVIASLVLTIGLFVLYTFFLNSGARSLSDFASQG